MPEAGPSPVLRLLDQAPLDWIAMHIAQLLYALLFVMHVEIVIARLPEWPFLALNGNR
jgi:hypothetical protein